MSMLDFNVRLLTDEDIAQIHRGALKVLATAGVRVDHPQVRSYLHAMGAKIEGEIARFPEAVVSDVVEEMRREGKLKPAPAPDARITGVATGQAIMAHDLETDALRPATTRDLADATRIVAALPEATLGHPVFIPQDVPPMVRDVYALITVAEHYPTSRSVEIFSRETVSYFLEIGQVIRGNYAAMCADPPFSYEAYATPPFRFGELGLDIVLQLRDAGIETGYGVGGVMPVLGASTPVTLAAYLVSMTAEALAANVINKAILDRPREFACGPAVLDFHHLSPSQSAPEAALLFLARVELARFYGSADPDFTYAMSSDAKLPDVQAGMEKAYKSMLALASGCRRLNTGLGVLSVAHVGSVIQLVIDYELCQMLNRLLRGITVNDETLAVDLIVDRGIDGDYLAEEHTVRHMRQELWFPDLFDRRATNAWLEDERGMMERAKEKVRAILAGSSMNYLDDSQLREVKRIAKKADRELG